VVVPFVDNAKLVVAPGMTGATGNVYAGLQEFEEMAFVLHLLRSGDLLVDVGANVGTFSVLASAVRGADVVAFEPVPETYRHLVDNVRINGMAERIDARNAGVGAARGHLTFTADRDCTNRALAYGEAYSGRVTQVEVTTLDETVGHREPLALKIDVEGYEDRVIAGGAMTLARPSLLAIVIELNGSGAVYGVRDATLRDQIAAFGFRSIQYHPFERRISLDPVRGNANYIYVRDIERVRERVERAPSFQALGINV
jgi:FkbM family methyltransferase